MESKKNPIKIERIVLLDCNAIIHRAYHALPPLATRKGEMVNAVYGFFMMFFKAIKDLKPDYIAAAFDLGGETFRHKEFKDYKAHRVEADSELYQQIPIVQDILKILGISILAIRGVEADDIIGSVSKDLAAECIIITGDMDMLQLIDEKVFVYAMRKGLSDIVLYDKKKVFERFGFGPEFITDFKGLKGDPSDNIPGVPGVGDKTASDLIKRLGSVEEIYQKIELEKADMKEPLKKKLLENKDIAMQSKYLATIKRDVKINFKLEEARLELKNIDEAKNKFEDLEMKSLIKRIKELEIGNCPPEADLPWVEKLEITETNKQRDQETGTVEEAAGQRSLFKESEQNLSVKERIEKYFKEEIFSKEIRELEIAVIPVIEEMEKNGIKIDTGILEDLSKEIAKKIKNIASKVYDFAGVEFNLSSPRQLAEVLFERLQLSKNGIKKTPGGVFSTSASELEKLADKSPIIPLLLQYRELEKLRNTYIDALPGLVDPKDGRIHTKFDQMGTVTGRISSSDPNLQNIPIRTSNGVEVRKAFVAEKGFKFVLFDYSQIDLRVIAHLSNDIKMVEAFKEGKDIHRITAAKIFGIKEKDVSDKMRRMAKTVNFGIIYGMSAFGMSSRSGVSRDEARKFIEGYFKEFSGVANYLEECKSEAKKRGYVETLFGRKRYVKELQSKNWQLRSAGERMAINMPIQGTSADIVKMAMAKVWEKSKIKNQKSKILLQAHDDLLFEISDELVDSGNIIKEIKDIMENVVELNVPLAVDVEMGDNWGEMEEIKYA